MDTHAHHHAFLCSGEVWPAHGGSWIGHVLPGAFLLVWGLHWFLSASYQTLTGTCNVTCKQRAVYHKIVFFPEPLQDLEPVLKIVLPAIAIVLEFSLSGTRYLRCPPGTAKAGELDVTHMNSWSHATNYPPIMLSGLVDLIHTRVLPLPKGVPQFFLSAAFGSSAFLMLSHTKGEPLDALLHQLLGYCMAAAAVAVLVQGFVGRGQGGFALNAGKSLAVIMEGCWFLAITHIMFSGDTTWSASRSGDMTRTMFTPVLFSWVFIGAITVLLVLYLGMHAMLVRAQRHTNNSAKQRTAKGSITQDSSCASGDDSSDGSMPAHSCLCDWRGCQPSWPTWRGYLSLAQHNRLVAAGGTAGCCSCVGAGDGALQCEGGTLSSSTDTSLEMV